MSAYRLFSSITWTILGLTMRVIKPWKRAWGSCNPKWRRAGALKAPKNTTGEANSKNVCWSLYFLVISGMPSVQNMLAAKCEINQRNGCCCCGLQNVKTPEEWLPLLHYLLLCMCMCNTCSCIHVQALKSTNCYCSLVVCKLLTRAGWQSQYQLLFLHFPSLLCRRHS